MRWMGLLCVLMGCGEVGSFKAPRSVLHDVLVPGVCPVSRDLSLIDVSVVLVGPSSALGPPASPRFEFLRLHDLDPGPAGRLHGPVGRDVHLTVESAEFRIDGGEARRDDRRLILLMVDSSGSLRGRGRLPPAEAPLQPWTGNPVDAVGRPLAREVVDDRWASDQDDQRFALLHQFIGNVPREHFISLISFNNRAPTIDPGRNDDGPAVPTRDRSITEQGLRALEQAEWGATPLARALTDGKFSILNPNSDLNPLVILLTDGVEHGDPNDDAERSGLRAAIAEYEAARIPVIVIHIQPPKAAGLPLGRDPLLVELACRTGGEYVFVESPEELTASESELPSLLRNRLAGRWVVRTRVDRGANLRSGSYFLSTELLVTLDGDTHHARLAAPRDPRLAFLDTRLWLTKP